MLSATQQPTSSSVARMKREAQPVSAHGEGNGESGSQRPSRPKRVQSRGRKWTHDAGFDEEYIRAQNAALASLRQTVWIDGFPLTMSLTHDMDEDGSIDLERFDVVNGVAPQPRGRGRPRKQTPSTTDATLQLIADASHCTQSVQPIAQPRGSGPRLVRVMFIDWQAKCDGGNVRNWRLASPVIALEPRRVTGATHVHIAHYILMRQRSKSVAPQTK